MTITCNLFLELRELEGINFECLVQLLTRGVLSYVSLKASMRAEMSSLWPEETWVIGKRSLSRWSRKRAVKGTEWCGLVRRSTLEIK